MDGNPVNPSHYQKPGGYETIDYIEAVTAPLPGDEAVQVGNILKYVSRYRQKHPSDPARDLKKARWYLDRLIAMVEGKQGQADLNELVQGAQWAPQTLPEGTGVIRPVEPVGVKLEKRCPRCAVREGELHRDWCPELIKFRTNT